MTTSMAERPDIWQCAALSLATHGERSPEFSARRISELTNEGNVAGVVLWGEIFAAIASLRNRPGWRRPPGTRKKRPSRSTAKPARATMPAPSPHSPPNPA